MFKPINPLGFADVLSSNLTARPWEYLFPSRAFMLWWFFPNRGFFTRVSIMHKALDLPKLPCWRSTAARKLHLISPERCCRYAAMATLSQFAFWTAQSGRGILKTFVQQTLSLISLYQWAALIRSSLQNTLERNIKEVWVACVRGSLLA